MVMSNKNWCACFKQSMVLGTATYADRKPTGKWRTPGTRPCSAPTRCSNAPHLLRTALGGATDAFFMHKSHQDGDGSNVSERFHFLMNMSRSTSSFEGYL
jgi:hypothetical protein